MNVPDQIYPYYLKKNLPTKKETLVMMIVTGIYLLFEVAFGARLLDVVGSTVVLEEIEQIENAGRFISGIALTLVVWTWLVLPGIRRRNRDVNGYPEHKAISAFKLFGSAGICLLISYGIQEAILESITRNSTPAQRQAASTLTLVSASVQSSQANLVGIDLDAVGRTSPEIKTFMALLPALALSVEDLEDKTAEAVDGLLLRQAENALGDPGEMFKDAYWPIMSAMMQGFNDVYQEAAREHRKGLAQMEIDLDKAYKAYRNGLGRPRPDQIPRGQFSKVRTMVRAQIGINVPYTWVPTDRKGFYEAGRQQHRGKVDGPYNRAIEAAFGTRLPNDLTMETFFKDPQVQWAIRDRMGITQHAGFPVYFAPGLESDDFKAQVYDKWVKHIVDGERPRYVAPIKDFEEGGKHFDDGIEAIRVAYVPFLAFGFSLLGALVHSFKTINFGLQTRIGYETAAKYKLLWGLKIAVFAMIAFGAFTVSKVTNPVTRSELFLKLEAQTTDKAGAPFALGIRTVTQLQPFAYPIAEGIRSTILLGITYDFDPETEEPAFQKLAFMNTEKGDERRSR